MKRELNSKAMKLASKLWKTLKGTWGNCLRKAWYLVKGFKILSDKLKKQVFKLSHSIKEQGYEDSFSIATSSILKFEALKKSWLSMAGYRFKLRKDGQIDIRKRFVFIGWYSGGESTPYILNCFTDAMKLFSEYEGIKR